MFSTLQPSLAPLAQFDVTQLVLLLAVIAMLTVVILSTRRKVRESINQPRVDVRDQVAARVRQAKLTRDLEEVMSEIDELARQVNGRLDTRFAKLEAVIRDADERIDHLSRLVRESKGQSGIDLTISDDPPIGEPQALACADSARAEARGSLDDRMPPELHADVYALADKGRSPMEIAEDTGRTTGEIELILALRRAKKQADAVSPEFETASTSSSRRV